MTPKNREQLQQRIKDWCKTPALFLDDLEAAGLAIVPVEPTEKMCGYGFIESRYDEGHCTRADAYRAMLAASPFAKEG